MRLLSLFKSLQIIMPVEEWLHPSALATSQLCISLHCPLKEVSTAVRPKTWWKALWSHQRMAKWVSFNTLPPAFSQLLLCFGGNALSYWMLPWVGTESTLPQQGNQSLVTSLIWPLQFAAILWNLGDSLHVDIVYIVSVSNKLSQSTEFCHLLIGLIDVVW